MAMIPAMTTGMIDFMINSVKKYLMFLENASIGCILLRPNGAAVCQCCGLS